MDRSASTPQCGRSKSNASGKVVPTLTYHAQDRGKTVSIAVGTRFSIELDENPTTGYRWSAPTFDEKYLVLEADEYTPAAGAAIGGGGIRQFVFAVKSAGRTAIRLENKRPWERDAAPAATFEMTVVGTR